MTDNIIDQTKEESLSGLISAFELQPDENFESWGKKVELLHDIYRLHSEHVFKNYNDLAVQVIYDRRFTCNKDKRIDQFWKKWIPWVDESEKSQKIKKVMWQEFLEWN